jgi:nucleoside-diphosphate-sugar epimerase
MRIAVVGARGFIGGSICQAIAAHGHGLVAITRGPASNVGVGDWRVVEAADSVEFARAFDGCGVVINAAGAAHIQSPSSAEAANRFVLGNEVLPAAIARAAKSASVARVVHVSSAGVLGWTSGSGALSDASAPQPYDGYTRSKLEAERALERELLGAAVSLICVRPPLVYGRNAPGNFARITGWLKRGLPLPLGSCSALRAMIGVRNLASLIVYLSAHDGPLPLSLVCRDWQTLSVADFARAVAERVSRVSAIIPVPVPVLHASLAILGRASDVRRLTQPFQIDLSHGLERMSWRPPFTVEQELDWSLLS